MKFVQSVMRRVDCALDGMQTVIGATVAIFGLSLGLWVYGIRFEDPASVPSHVLALFAASWAGVLGLAAFAVISAGLYVRFGHKCR